MTRVPEMVSGGGHTHLAIPGGIHGSQKPWEWSVPPANTCGHVAGRKAAFLCTPCDGQNDSLPCCGRCCQRPLAFSRHWALTRLMLLPGNLSSKQEMPGDNTHRRSSQPMAEGNQ